PGAGIVGNILMDKKMYGTVHTAFGNNSTTNIRIDVTISKPTVYVDGRMIIRDGEWFIWQLFIFLVLGYLC
ncbi:MAG: hypothetical protein QXX93_01335, partial [Desulfurococcaceae archaeon]